MEIEITEDTFGTHPGGPDQEPRVVQRFTMTNPANGFSAQVINYGATLISLKAHNRNGLLDDVVLGFDSIEGYLENTTPYFRGTIGRTAGRIAKGHFTLDGTEYQLSINNGENHLHGGFIGFDKKMWEPSISGGRVVFSYHSTDGAEGYPGDLFTQVTFQLTTFNQLIIEYQAIVSKPCPVGYTNHTYFNLAGHQNGDKKLAGHFITINADNITPVNPVDLIITGEIAPVDGTRFDLRGNPDLHALLQQYPEGYDINYCLNLGDQQVFNARMEDSESGRVMILTTDQPGMQLFTANGFPEEGAPPIVGKDGANYFKHGAFCFEAQNYPDAVNHAHFPTVILRPGNIHQHRTIYAFATMQK